MIPFRIHKNAREHFFSELRGKNQAFKIDFDILYFCFMAAISDRPKSRKEEVPLVETVELVSYFPESYLGRGRLLVALFLSAELQQLGVPYSEREAMHSQIERLVSPESSNFLTEEGVREFNKYVYGGYRVLCDWFDDKPRTLESFLRTFYYKLDEVLGA